MKHTILIFGSLATGIFLLFELSKLSRWSSGGSSEIFLVVSALSFILVGILLNKFLAGRRDGRRIPAGNDSGLTKQEHKVLYLVSDGLSNNEIAENLFISESTVKTHVSNILSKLQAKRRTEAVKIGRDLDLI